MGLRALHKRVAKMEKAEQPKPSPLVLLFGSFDQFAEQVLPGIEAGVLDRRDMVDVVAALRAWETDGTWERAYAR
jgi:hypothetical protein